MLKLYGTRRSRAFRCLWMLEEAELEYQLIKVDFSNDENLTEDYLALNPNGRVPTLVDDNLVLYESLAINYYLAQNYALEFWPDKLADKSRALTWLAWALAELEGPHDAANRLERQVETERVLRSCEMLIKALAANRYVFGDQFSVVDLNTAAMLLRPQYRPIARSHVVIGEWLERCMDRPALQKALER